MDKGIDQLLPLFLYTMRDYERITAYVAVSEGLRLFDFTSATTAGALASYESDSVAIDVRLMLQRKYFQHDEGLHWKKLLKSANDTGTFDKHALYDMSRQMENAHSQPIELVLSDGSTISEQYRNAEDVIYGSLLHGDVDRVMRSINFPVDMRLLSLAPYVLAREALLLEFRDLCFEAGVKPIGSNAMGKAAVLRQEKGSKSNLGVKKSPYWSSIIGRDADESDLEAVANYNTLDDNIVFLIASEFFILLREEPLNRQALRKLVWKRNWPAWGNFESAAKAMRSIQHPGASSKISHEGGSQFAQVRILPNVIEPWMTDVPQLVSNTACTICLAKRRGTWKISGIVTMNSAMN